MKIGTVLQNWAQAALAKLDEGYVCLVAVCEAKGSAPRESGAAMLVYNNHIDGSIGGGELEFQAIKTARKDIPETAFAREVRSYPLGPALGQCCGGHVKLIRFGAACSTETGLQPSSSHCTRQPNYCNTSI